jgi:hypothetical protein
MDFFRSAGFWDGKPATEYGSDAGKQIPLRYPEKRETLMNPTLSGFGKPWTDRVVDEHELGRPHLRFRNPIVSGGLEGLRQALYDIYRVDANTTAPTVVLFAVPIGGQYNSGVAVAFQKTLLHTNMKLAGVLQSPNKHLVRSLKIRVSGEPSGTQQNIVNPVDLLSFLYGTLVNFTVNDKPYFQGEAGELPQGGGALAALGAATTTAATNMVTGISNNGLPDTRNMWSTVYDGISIEQTQTFSVILDPTQENLGAFKTLAAGGTTSTGPGTGLSVKFELDGILFRGIQ